MSDWFDSRFLYPTLKQTTLDNAILIIVAVTATAAETASTPVASEGTTQGLGGKMKSDMWGGGGVSGSGVGVGGGGVSRGWGCCLDCLDTRGKGSAADAR